jgi:hypothetical protein
MAHFRNHKGERITEATLPKSMNSGAESVTIGFWGFEVFEWDALMATVSAIATNGPCSMLRFPADFGWGARWTLHRIDRMAACQ